MKTVFPLILLLLATTAVHAASKVPDFNFEVRPILSQHCYSCHGPDEEGRKAELRLDTYAGATTLHDGLRAIDPENPAKSEVLHRIHTDDPDEIMPPPETKRVMTDKEKKILEAWIKSGAAYEEHWAFMAPEKAELPSGKRPRAWRENPVDAFIYDKAKQAGLKPMSEAEKTTLIRRVTFDLTGLPPTPEDVEAFLKDKSTKAFEKVVDRLLASEQYGERMALAWMDASRYGDSSVMHADGPRTMWPWRDWVIRSYNDNKSFDAFTVEQIAGDLLPDATEDQKLATGFNRNHPTSDEGGAFPEELRVEYIVDRVKTTGNIWLGLSMECAQCHDHKYDPIPMTEYYRFYAFFNNNADPGMQTRGGNQAPIVTLENKERDHALAENGKRQDVIRKKLDARRTSVGPDARQWAVDRGKELESDESFKAQPSGLRHHITFHEVRDKKATELFSGTAAEVKGQIRPGNRDGSSALKVNGNDALDFKEMADFVEYDKPFSLAVRVKNPAKRTAALLSRMNKVDGGDMRGFDIWVENKDIGFHLIHAYPGNLIRVMTRETLKPNKWHHVAVTYDGSGKAAGVQFYVDGEAQKLHVDNDSLTGTVQHDAPFRIAGRFPTMNFQGEVDDVRVYDRVLSEAEVGAIRDDKDEMLAVLATSADQRSEHHQAYLEAQYLENYDETFKAATAELKEVQKDEAAINKKYPLLTSMIMADNPKVRMTYMLNRGLYDQPMEDRPVTPGVPTFLPAPPEDSSPDRLGLARWLVQEDQPLTARVAVNRYWSMLFGRGIVESEMDFGNQGAAPSHPELIDWLAVDFVESGWDIKRMIRMLVTSQTYRQSAKIQSDAYGVDPENRLLARGTRFRLQGEFIRDHALMVSGLLNPVVGGESVKPYQPPGIWNEVSLNGGLRYKQDKGEKLHRRSMYTYWKRSAPAPNMMIFDAPTREKCTVRRPRTNTPLQALVTLNDIHFVEAARKFAERIMNEGGESFDARIQYAYRLALSREATEEEIDICREVFERQLSSFTENPADAAKYLSYGEAPRDDTIDTVQHAAYAVIVNMILNLDECLMRG